MMAVAVVAALAATLGDGLLLLVANAARPELGWLPQGSERLLLLGTYLGALALPCYGLGYREIARGLAGAGARAAWWVAALGAVGGVLGGTVHAVTGVVLHDERLHGVVGADPITVVLRQGAYLVPFWAVLAVITLVGSTLFAATVASGRTVYPRWLGALGPAPLIALLALVAAPSATLRAFLLPAAPNVAHVVFFAAAARSRRSRQRR